MGLYLNSRKPYNNYQEIVNSTYFVDKTGLLEELIPIVGSGNRAAATAFHIGQNKKAAGIILELKVNHTPDFLEGLS